MYTTRKPCDHCKTAPADVVENDTEYSCAGCWLDRHVSKEWRKEYAKERANARQG